MFRFDPQAYGEQVAALLSLDGNGQRLMPLAKGTCSHAEARNRLQHVHADQWFPRARSAEAALAGLWLYFSCLDESHAVSQRIPSIDGSFWHGILHRQEPDPGNAAYWFRRTGAHPVFPLLRQEAALLSYPVESAWDPFAFIDYCERARLRPGSHEEQVALQVQRLEWQLLFDHCARPVP